MTEGRIRFADVGFAYALGNPVLKQFNMTIAGRDRGAGGCQRAGKSTLSKLLFRFYDPTEGAVEIDGTDIRSVSLDSVRRPSPALRTAVLYDTLRENIARRPSAADEEVALRSCFWGCHGAAPSRLESRGEPGGSSAASASGTMRSAQDAPILVFDEATSSLDSHSEQAVMSAFRAPLDDTRRWSLPIGCRRSWMPIALW